MKIKKENIFLPSLDSSFLFNKNEYELKRYGENITFELE